MVFRLGDTSCQVVSPPREPGACPPCGPSPVDCTVERATTLDMAERSKPSTPPFVVNCCVVHCVGCVIVNPLSFQSCKQVPHLPIYCAARWGCGLPPANQKCQIQIPPNCPAARCVEIQAPLTVFRPGVPTPHRYAASCQQP